MDMTPYQLPMGATTTAGGAIGTSSTTVSILPLLPGGVAPTGTGVQVRMCIDGNRTAFWCWGDGPAVVGTSTPALPGTAELYTVPIGCGSVSYIAAATGSSAYLTPGTGS